MLSNDPIYIIDVMVTIVPNNKFPVNYLKIIYFLTGKAMIDYMS
jgi:hypothetical protein